MTCVARRHVHFTLIPVDGFRARRIADLELALSVAAGPHIRDPRVVPAPLDGTHPEIPVRVALVAILAERACVRRWRSRAARGGRAGRCVPASITFDVIEARR